MYQKSDLVTKISEKTDSTKKEAERFVDAYIDSVKDLIMDEKEDGLHIHGFETYEVKTIPAKVYRNPKTGEPVPKEETARCDSKLSPKIKKLQF